MLVVSIASIKLERVEGSILLIFFPRKTLANPGKGFSLSSGQGFAQVGPTFKLAKENLIAHIQDTAAHFPDRSPGETIHRCQRAAQGQLVKKLNRWRNRSQTRETCQAFASRMLM